MEALKQIPPEKGDEFELSLELSIGGGRYGKQTEENPKRGRDCCSDGDCNNVLGIPRSDNEGGGLGRKEIQALRRQEAKKKREERMKKSSSRGVVEDKLGLFESHKFQIRVRDREIREKDDGNEGLYHRVQPASAHSSASFEWTTSSDYHTTSHKGGSSNDSGSQSNLQPSHALTKSSPDRLQPNESASPGEPDTHHLQATLERTTKTFATPVLQPTHINKFTEKSIVVPTNNHPSTLAQPSPKEVSGPHIPKRPPDHTHSATSPHMPCVSTTGNGPNGKTITGFLYKYTNDEVSIMCVCHGSSFSPAEFVEHAGGVNISNPLRHITVIPSSLRCS